MWEIISGFFRQRILNVIAFAAIAAGIAGALLSVRNAGKQAERLANLKSTLAAVKTKTRTYDEVLQANEPERSRLRDKWTRDKGVSP